MKTFKIINKIFLLAFLTLFFASCTGKKQKDKINVRYYVDEPSSKLDLDGQPQKLYVRFDGSVCKIEDVGAKPSSSIQINPAISGSWKWLDDTTLAFSPSEAWQLNTKYKFSMPDSIFSDSVIVNSDFSFKTEPFKVNLEDAEFYINPQNPSQKAVTCTIKASHPLIKESVSNCLELEFSYLDSKGKVSKKEPLSYHLTFNNAADKAFIVSDFLEIPPYTSTVSINLKKGLEAQLGGKSLDEDKCQVSVPGMSDYVKILNVNTSLVKNSEENYDQMLVIETKGSVSVEELAEHLTAYELPKDLPDLQGWKGQKDFSWTPTYVTEEVLKLSKKIEVKGLPTEEAASSLNSFSFKATPNRYIYVKITGGINFFGGYKLRFSDKSDDAFQQTLKVPEYPRELSIMSEGTILSLSGSRKMALYSRGVAKVFYRLSRIMPKDVNHLVSMSNGDMKNFKFSNYNFNENNISESEVSSYLIPDWSREKVSYFSYDFTNKIKRDLSKNLKNGLFLFQVTDQEKLLGKSDYYSGLSDKRLILITDLGFIVKKNADGSRDVFVQSISSGLPVPYATVKVLGLNGNTLISTQTDSNGHAKLPVISDFKGEHRPTAFIVESATDLAFMPYSENGRLLDYSNFDIGGEYGRSEANRITTYIFNDRGIYRPGEKVHIAFIAKAGNWNTNLKGTPLEAEIVDSNGAIAFTKKLQLSASGFEEVDFTSQSYSPTGSYKFNLYLIKDSDSEKKREFLSSNSFKVEEFLPDTLSISTNFLPLPSSGWINPEALKGNISLKNLFGTPAQGNEVKAQIMLSPGFPILNKYSDYSFSDPYFKGKHYEEYLGSRLTDEKGQTSFDIDLSKYEKASYRLQFYAEGFEKGSGRNVSSQTALYVSPLKYLIGYKADGSLDYINFNSVRKLSFIAIDKNLNKIDVDDVTLKIEEIRYISTLVKQSNGLYKYQSVKKAYPVKEESLKISKNGSDILLPSNIPGEYKLTLTDSQGLIFNTINYSIIGEKNIARSLTRSAELELKLKNADLTPGSSAQIFIKAPYPGTGLITIERDHVYTYKWFQTSSLSSVQTITIPQELEGNGYINVMFTRSINSDEIFMSPFCYGAIPFSVGQERRKNKINLSVPDQIKAGTDLKISYSSSDSGKIVIYAVDEGILQVARYSTPNPLAEFFRKRALEVSTSQILDLILPEYNILKTLPASGGGAGMDMLAKNLNPFKRKQNDSVAYWSGLLETGPDKRSVTYHVPDYFNGSIRVMAVAVSSQKIGVASSSTVAKNPLIITPNVPLVAAPGDEFDVSVTVTNCHKGSGNNQVILKAVADEHIQILGQDSAILNIEEGKDARASFKVKANEVLGSAELKFLASDKTENVKLSSYLSVRPSMPYQVWISAGLSKKKSVETNVNRRLYEEYSERKVSVSNVPASYVQGLNFYLEKYPYGCAEQITSKAYPYLYEDFVKASGKTHADAVKMVNETISIIQSRQKYDGNIGYWTSNSPTEPLITLYCAEFLTDASKKGFYVPSSLMEKVLDAVKNIANDRDSSFYSNYLRSYAIFILTKNDIVTTSYIELFENDFKSSELSACDYEGLYLAASYSMLKQDKKANSILNKIKLKKTFDASWAFHNSLHYISTYIDIISTYFPARISEIKGQEIEELSNYLTNNYYNTYSTAAAVKAIESYAYTDKSGVYKAYAITGKEESELSLSGSSILEGNYKDNAEKIKYVCDGSMPLFYQTLQAGFERKLPEKIVKEGIEVSREYLSENGGKLSQIKLGDTITVKISFRALKGALDNIAMIDMLPAGFESDIQSIRYRDNSKWSPDYVDIREDRIIIYGSLTENVNTFTYKAKAVSSGKFVVPPMFAEGMYNRDIKALYPCPAITILPSN